MWNDQIDVNIHILKHVTASIMGCLRSPAIVLTMAILSACTSGMATRFVSMHGVKLRAPPGWSDSPSPNGPGVIVSNQTGSASLQIEHLSKKVEDWYSEMARLIPGAKVEQITKFGHLDGEGMRYSKTWEHSGGGRTEDTTFVVKRSATWIIFAHFSGGAEDRAEFDLLVESLTLQ